MQVAQCAGRFTKAYIEDGVADDKEEFEWRRLFALVFAAVVYCAGAGWLIAVRSSSHSLEEEAHATCPVRIGSSLVSPIHEYPSAADSPWSRIDDRLLPHHDWVLEETGDRGGDRACLPICYLQRMDQRKGGTVAVSPTTQTTVTPHG